MKISKRWLFGCICLIAAIWGLLSDTSESTTDKEVLHCVQRGPLSITVAESGTLSSQQEVKIKSQVDGRKTILFLIEEGTRVEKGMILGRVGSCSFSGCIGRSKHPGRQC